MKMMTEMEMTEMEVTEQLRFEVESGQLVTRETVLKGPAMRKEIMVWKTHGTGWPATATATATAMTIHSKPLHVNSEGNLNRWVDMYCIYVRYQLQGSSNRFHRH